MLEIDKYMEKKEKGDQQHEELGKVHATIFKQMVK